MILPEFTGSSVHKIDEKGRLVLSKKVLDQVAPAHRKFTVTAGLDGCVLLLDAEGWSQVSGRFSSTVLASRTERAVRRRFLGLAEQVEPDKAGRVTLPKALRRFAGIDGDDAEVVVVGAGRSLEIWSQERLNNTLLEPTEEELALFDAPAVPVGTGSGNPASGSDQ